LEYFPLKRQDYDYVKYTLQYEELENAPTQQTLPEPINKFQKSQNFTKAAQSNYNT